MKRNSRETQLDFGLESWNCLLLAVLLKYVKVYIAQCLAQRRIKFGSSLFPADFKLFKVIILVSEVLHISNWFCLFTTHPMDHCLYR